jgi:uncharacterized zinc-type alcohol dehydrogenase-like protein
MIKAVGYAAKSAHDKLHPFQFEREEPKAGEVVIEVLYCGVCHSDIHQVKNEWSEHRLPLRARPRDRRPRHQGSARPSQAPGGRPGRRRLHDRQLRPVRSLPVRRPELLRRPQQLAGHLQRPDAAEEQVGENIYGRDNTFGGYSNMLVVKEDFVLKIPAGLKPEVARRSCARA